MKTNSSRRRRQAEPAPQRAAPARHQGHVAAVRRTGRQGRLARRPLPRRDRRTRTGRTRSTPHRAPSRRGPPVAGKDPRHLRVRRRADDLQGAGDGDHRRRQLAREGRQPAPVRPARWRKEPSRLGHRPRPHRERLAGACSPAPPISSRSFRSRAANSASKPPSTGSIASTC